MYFNLIQNCKKNVLPAYKRAKYFSRIEKYLNNSFIKVIVGQRRAGKSYFLFQIIDHLQSIGVKEKQIVYINKELDIEDIIIHASDLEKAIDDYIHQQKLAQNEKLYIFIDEIQDILQWEKIIRKWKALGQYEIFITGSNSKLLSGELSTFLSGRYIELTIYPFDFIEYCEFQHIDINQHNFDNYLMYGGMPETIILEPDIKYDILSTLLDSILFRDVVCRYKINNVKLFEKIVKYLALNIGNLFNAKNLENYLSSKNLKLSLPTISSYLKYLEHSFLVHPIDRYDIKGKSTLEFSQKVYFNDIGLRNAISVNDLQYKSKMLENIVFLTLISNGWKVYVGKFGDQEIDFIAHKNNEWKYIQVVWFLISEKVIHREFSNLLNIKTGHPKMVVGYSDEVIGNYEGIKYMPIIDFILDANQQG